jgi:hypothetical protein
MPPFIVSFRPNKANVSTVFEAASLWNLSTGVWFHHGDRAQQLQNIYGRHSDITDYW